MGFLTNVSISNDYWHNIAKDPQKLVDAISVMMNDGMDSPLGDALDAQEGRASMRRYKAEQRREVPQGVIVHHARHYDDPQIIVNTYGTRAIAAHEIAYAIPHGWLALNRYNRQHAEDVAKTLEDEARAIREALRKADQ